MIDGQVVNSIWRRKTQVYGHTSTAIRFKPQATPTEHASTCWAEQYLSR
ncbi:hypothetical protein M728_004027 (plasmid) [Ensifer sp. WSM1721]